MKKNIPEEKARRLINCGNVLLVTSGFEGKQNILTLAWSTPLSNVPPLIGISVSRGHYTSELITSSGEFVLNIPDMSLLEKVVYCGKHSGRTVDKYKETGLTPATAKKVTSTQVISNCIGHIECSLAGVHETGDHNFFIGEVLHAEVETSLFDEVWNVEKATLIFHLGGNCFTMSGKMVLA
jgi:flavin reductase (DIM6/NTAB) family NADH-FMN oxidoreductase RutF